MGERSTFFPVFTFYFLPIAAWIAFTYFSAPLNVSWIAALIGLALLSFGSALFVTILPARESPQEAPKVEKPSYTEPTPVKVEEKEDSKLNLLVKSLQEENQSFLEQIEKAQRKHAEDEEALEHERNESQLLKEKIKTVLEEEHAKVLQAQNKIEDLQLESHQKQQVIQQLENQIHDLRYEIKTLLHLTEVDYKKPQAEFAVPKETKESSPFFQDEEFPKITTIRSHEDAKQILKKCLNIAKKLSSGYRASSSPLLGSDPYAFDLRRLSDELKQETGGIILLYSPSEDRVVFVNKEVRTLLGWNPEKFTVEFHSILGDGYKQWRQNLDQLLTKNETSFSLTLKNKTDEKIHLDVLMGAISSGIFRSLVACVIFPAVLFEEV